VLVEYPKGYRDPDNLIEKETMVEYEGIETKTVKVSAGKQR